MGDYDYDADFGGDELEEPLEEPLEEEEPAENVDLLPEGAVEEQGLPPDQGETPGTAPTPGAAKTRITFPVLTRYERARILGMRALMLSMNAPPLVELEGLTDPYLIAKKELEERKIPFIIRRYLPDGSHEDWTIQELQINDR
eukprot:GEZU01020905.1.p1 GENE.GEZU01020905.1~~GEZU01020905.1.p1  ORF type:complete len:143 (+),score=31.04 GEZU01020905.1:37-465(+)